MRPSSKRQLYVSTYMLDHCQGSSGASESLEFSLTSHSDGGMSWCTRRRRLWRVTWPSSQWELHAVTRSRWSFALPWPSFSFLLESRRSCHTKRRDLQCAKRKRQDHAGWQEASSKNQRHVEKFFIRTKYKAPPTWGAEIESEGHLIYSQCSRVLHAFKALEHFIHLRIIQY